MKKNEKQRRTVVIVCCVVLVALLVLIAVQINKMGLQVTPFFDEHGLPTLLFDLAAAMFGVVLLILGRNIREENTSLRKLCRVIGILEIAAAVIYFAMTQILLSALK